MIAARWALQLSCLAAACAPASPSTPETVADPALWCLVETRSIDESQDVALHARPAAAIQVSREAVPAGPDVYSERFGDTAKAGVPVSLSATRLADGTWLVALSGNAEWWERTLVVLQVETSGARGRVLSAHLGWSADVPPYGAWAALDWGWIRLDDADVERDGVLRIAFELNGELVDPLRKPDDPLQRVRAGGNATLRLREGALPPLDDGLRDSFESVAATR